MGGDGLDGVGLESRGGSGILEVIETEILGGQPTRGMLDIGGGRGRFGLGSDRGIGDGDRRATGENRRGKRRGAERKSHLNVLPVRPVEAPKRYEIALPFRPSRVAVSPKG